MLLDIMFVLCTMQCVDPQTGQGMRRRYWKIKTPAQGNQGACIDVGKTNEWRDAKDFYGAPCKYWNGSNCHNGGRNELQEDVLCINRNETITGQYSFRSTFTSVPKYKDVAGSGFYEGLIATQVFGYDQTMKMEREKAALLTHCNQLKPKVSAKNCKSVVVRVLMSVVECTGF